MTLTEKEQSIIQQLLASATFTGSSLEDMYCFKKSLDSAVIEDEA